MNRHDRYSRNYFDHAIDDADGAARAAAEGQLIRMSERLWMRVALLGIEVAVAFLLERRKREPAP